MDTNIHKHTKVNNIANRSGKHHSRLQVLQFQYICPQNGGRKLITGISARFQQFLNNVLQCGNAHTTLRCGAFYAHISKSGGKLGNTACRYILPGITAQRKQFFRCIIGFRMDTGIIKNLLALRHTQEACTLLVSLGSQLGNLFQLTSGGECTVFVTEGYDIFSRCGCDTWNVFKKWGWSRIKVNAYRVYAVFNDACKGFLKSCLGKVVLILTYTYGLGVDFNKLGKRVLKSSCYRNRRTKGYIKLGEFLSAELWCGINGSTCLVYYHIAYFSAVLLYCICNEYFRFLWSRTVTYGYAVYAEFFNKRVYLFCCLLFFVLRGSGVNNTRWKHFAVFVYNGNFTACSVGRVNCKHTLILNGRLHKKRL